MAQKPEVEIEARHIIAWLKEFATDEQRLRVAIAAFREIRADSERGKVADVILAEFEKNDAVEPGA